MVATVAHVVSAALVLVLASIIIAAPAEADGCRFARSTGSVTNSLGLDSLAWEWRFVHEAEPGGQTSLLLYPSLDGHWDDVAECGSTQSGEFGEPDNTLHVTHLFCSRSGGVSTVTGTWLGIPVEGLGGECGVSILDVTGSPCLISGFFEFPIAHFDVVGGLEQRGRIVGEGQLGGSCG